jgi:endoglycosylceramidase
MNARRFAVWAAVGVLVLALGVAEGAAGLAKSRARQSVGLGLRGGTLRRVVICGTSRSVRVVAQGARVRAAIRLTDARGLRRGGRRARLVVDRCERGRWRRVGSPRFGVGGRYRRVRRLLASVDTAAVGDYRLRVWVRGDRLRRPARSGLVYLRVAASGGGGGGGGAGEVVELPAAAGRSLGFLRVGGVDGPAQVRQIVDERGREVLLKGVNVDGLVDYFRSDLRPPYPIDRSGYAGGACPPDDPSVEGVMVCEFDVDQMRPLGYDAIRLNLSWSLLEPSPGAINQTYLDRIAQVVGWARAQGIYVVLDMHQDAWSKYVYTRPGDTCPPGFRGIRGFDGAPEWASAHVLPACALNGVRELDPAVQEDFQKLYLNAPAPDGAGLQEHYAAAMVALARRFASDPAVAGYEIINEPSPGYNAAPGETDATQLFPFYGKVVNTVVSQVLGFRQLFFIEPNVERDVTDQSAIVTPWSAYSSYANVVYAPHIYTGVFTLDQQVASRRFFPNDGGYRSAIADAQALGLPLWVGEFGNNPSDDETLLRGSYSLQDRYLLGGALWLWKENANDINGSVFWGVYGKPFGRGVPVASRIKFTSRAFPLYTAGHLRSFAYDPDQAAFDLRADSGGVAFGDRSRATLVFVPGASARYEVRAVGARLETVDRGSGREVYAYPAGGPYRVYTALPSGPASLAIGGQRITLLVPRGCIRAHRRFTARVATRQLRVFRGHHSGARLVRVDFFLDGRRRATRRHRPFRARLDTTALSPGIHVVRARIYLQRHNRLRGHARTPTITRTLTARIRVC